MFAVFYEYVDGDSYYSHKFIGVADKKESAQTMISNYRRIAKLIGQFSIEYRKCYDGMYMRSNSWPNETYVVTEIIMNEII